MDKHQKIVGDEMYYWLRPLIFVPGAIELAFSWHDSWEDAKSLLNTLCSPDDGLLFQDKNQGWEFQAFAEADRLYLWQSRARSGVEDLVVATSRSDFARQVQEVRERVEVLLPQLTKGVGADHWTRR